MSCVKEVRSSESPVCYKRAYVVKIIAKNDEQFKFEEVNIPLGVIKASSLQVNSLDLTYIYTCILIIICF